jgi:hypothetical protein
MELGLKAPLSPHEEVGFCRMAPGLSSGLRGQSTAPVRHPFAMAHGARRGTSGHRLRGRRKSVAQMTCEEGGPFKEARVSRLVSDYYGD